MFNELVVKKKSVIVNRWIQLIFETYASETSKFLNVEKDQFSNPVGFTTSEAVNQLFDALIKDINPGTVKPLLIDLIKIRAVQDFTPSQAVGFVLLIKDAMRGELNCELKEKNLYNDLLKFESEVDKAALIAFDLYQECREKVYRIHLNEIKTNSLSVL
ncbi:MAG: RsbRD N-terminal domain-containing protein [Ignavibacteria bacterium]|nr:RsbRD N-terminal domain-containing protein [Ignavibacteria bacterium]MBT8392987.1 RsbRD N-terminal domain-containing protein [Ignavibacteria bacterium]NNJ53871.1 RsbRD N-terminal domain-containing protein [Ignavibacteriaceae bacterium]NNL22610.1 RsbRD N-terminal domain-containing protein [Ignavibacteriaceae bacterium]